MEADAFRGLPAKAGTKWELCERSRVGSEWGAVAPGVEWHHSQHAPAHEELLDLHVERLCRFVDRGLRIEDHSFIGEHVHRLVNWAHKRVTLAS